VALKTRKTAQTGVLHTWKLHANDYDVKICPLRAMIRLAMLYGEGIELSSPLFLRVSSTGAVMQPMPVVYSFCISLRLLTLPLFRPAESSAARSPRTFKISDTSLGHCMALILSAEVGVSTESRTKVGPSTWWPRGVGGHRSRL
jgi:hypothetical protein